MRETLLSIVTDIKTGAIVSTSTTATGIATVYDVTSVLDFIPDNIKNLVLLIGGVLSLVLIYVHLLSSRKIRIEIEKIELEKQLIQRQLDETN